MYYIIILYVAMLDIRFIWLRGFGIYIKIYFFIVVIWRSKNIFKITQILYDQENYQQQTIIILINTYRAKPWDELNKFDDQ